MRTDDKFSQKVRNLKSHDTLEKSGFATFIDRRYYITDDGEKLATDGVEILRFLMDQGFTAEEREAALENNFDDIVIEEGERTVANRSVIERSQVLRDEAVKYFSDQNGSIKCFGCGFQAEVVYGPEFRGLIDTHHTRPLSLNAGSERKSAIDTLNLHSPDDALICATPMPIQI
jgi:hypothetical protein